MSQQQNSTALAQVTETTLEQVGGCQAEIQGFKNNAEEAQKTAKEAQRTLVELIDNLHRAKELPQCNGDEGSEILDRMDEAKRILDEEVGEMEEDQERQHREHLDE